MAESHSAEAVKSIQGLWTASVVFSIVWLLFVPRAIEQNRIYQAALDLTSWKLLSDLGKSLPTSNSDRYLLAGYVKNNPQENFRGEEPPAYNQPLLGMRCFDIEGDEDSLPGRHCDPLVVQSDWPDKRQISVFLSTDLLSKDDGLKDESSGTSWRPWPGAGLNHFRVVSRSGVLPLSSYIISRLGTGNRDEYLVSHIDDQWTKVALAEWPIHKTVVYSRPLLMAEIFSYLGVSNLDSITAEKLKEFQHNADPSQASLEFGGIKLNAIYALPSVGLVFAAVAFLLIGPLIVLQRNPGEESGAWTMAICTHGMPALETIITCISVLWACLPLIFAIVQLQLISPTTSMGLQVLRYASTLGLFFAAIIFVRCAMALRFLRKGHDNLVGKSSGSENTARLSEHARPMAKSQDDSARNEGTDQNLVLRDEHRTKNATATEG